MAAVTRERIFAIADRLDGEGQNPTLAAVRKALGAGSFTTISEIMTEWKARKATKEKPATEPAPESLADRLAELGGEIWALALESANGRFTAERDALEATRVQLEAEKSEAVELADQVTAELEAAKGEITALTAAELATRKEAEDAKAQVAGITERATIAEALAVEIEKRATDLNTELERLHQANTELVKALAAAASSKEGGKKTT